MYTDMNILRDKAHTIAKAKGFWDNPLRNEVYLMLVITELSEAVEADRKGKRTEGLDLDWAKATVDEMHLLQEHFPEKIKDTVEDELADAIIRLLDLAGGNDEVIVLSEDKLQDAESCCESESFAETIYWICTKCLGDYSNRDLDDIINESITCILGLCAYLKIDIMYHIELKMKYNALRDKMHGKAY